MTHLIKKKNKKKKKKKESITICVKTEIEAKEIRDNFNNFNKYKLNIIICGDEEPISCFSKFLLANI